MQIGLVQKDSLDDFNNMQDHVLLPGVIKWDECSHKYNVEKKFHSQGTT